MDVWQQTTQSSRFLALAVCLALTLAGGEAAAQGKKKAAPWVGTTAEGKPCKGGQPTSGPFDYLHRRQLVGELQVVEEHHFDSNVENLIKGITTEPMGDIDFTLRSFPNHHRALNSAMKFRLRHKRFPPNSKGQPAECYLQRAIAFSPRDPIPHGMLGYTFHKLGKPNRAVDPYKKAIEMAPGDMMLKYNLGLALADLERYRQARKYAEEVYAVGFPLPALKRRLLEAGHWEGATVEPKESKSAKAPEQQSKKEELARALAEQQAADGNGLTPAESGTGFSQQEELVAARQAQEASSEQSAGAKPAGAEDDKPAKTLSKKEQFAALIAAQQAKQAEGGDNRPEEPDAGEQRAAPTNAEGKPLSKEEQLAIIAAAMKNKSEQAAADAEPMSQKEKFAAAMAAKAKKDAAPAPARTLSDVDPETRKEQFAAKLAEKGLLEDEESPEAGAEGEDTAADKVTQDASNAQAP